MHGLLQNAALHRSAIDAALGMQDGYCDKKKEEQARTQD
jgi:hypothetical protein